MFYPPAHLLVSNCGGFTCVAPQQGSFLGGMSKSLLYALIHPSDVASVRLHLNTAAKILPIVIGAFPSCPLRCGSCCSESRKCGYVGILLVVQQS